MVYALGVGLCQGQSAESQVAAALQKMEHAEQTGDAGAWIALWSREKSADMEKLRNYLRPQPNRQYHASRIFVQGDEAAVLAQAGPTSFVGMILRKEDGHWKIADQLWSESPPDANAVYAMVPPAGGAFSRDGFPWDRSATAMDANKAASLGWQMRSVFDESFLYLRIETQTDLPAPGSTIEQPPGGWPVMKVVVAGIGEFVLLNAVNVGDQATFGEDGKAKTHRHFAAYSIRLERNDREIFSASADLHPSRLIDVSGRHFDFRIPLRTLGVADARAAKITIGDAQWPKTAIFSVAAPRYPR